MKRKMTIALFTGVVITPALLIALGDCPLCDYTDGFSDDDTCQYNTYSPTYRFCSTVQTNSSLECLTEDWLTTIHFESFKDPDGTPPCDYPTEPDKERDFDVNQCFHNDTACGGNS